MKLSKNDIKKINIFNSLSDNVCEEISNKIKLKECKPNNKLFSEGETGSSMILVFQGQIEISKNMAVKSSDGFLVTQKPIIRFETTDPPPDSDPITESTVKISKKSAFGIGEFSLVLDNAIRTANVYSTTNLVYGILKLSDFTNIVKKYPEIGGKIYFEVAKSAVQNLAVATQDISNLTQAFFYVLNR